VNTQPQHNQSHCFKTFQHTGVIAGSQYSRNRSLRTILIGTAVLSAAIALTSISFNVKAAEPTHGVAINGDLKYPKDFTHFDYVNPDAPKGGTITQARTGTYTNLNPFVLKGVSAIGNRRIHRGSGRQALGNFSVAYRGSLARWRSAYSR